MNPNDAANQLVIKARPIMSWVIALILILMSIIVFAINNLIVGAILFVTLALLILLFSSSSTVTADRIRRTLTISSQSVFGKKISEHSFNEVASFEVESSRSHDIDSDISHQQYRTNYRVVMVKTNGERVPLQKAFTSHYDDKARKAKALSQFLNLSGWEDKPTNLFQSAMQAQVAVTAKPAMAKSGTTSGVNWDIEVHTIGGKPVTRWISADYTCPGNFLLVSQKPANSPAMGGGGGFLGNLMTMVYQQILGMYGFLPSDTPGFNTASAINADDPRFDKNYSPLTNEKGFGKSLLNPWTLTPFIEWADHHPLKTVNTSDQVGQLAVLYSPRGLQAAILGSLPETEFDELISLGVELVKAQGGGRPAA